MLARDDAEVDVPRSSLIPDRARTLEAEPARAVSDHGGAAGADVLTAPVRLPEMDPRSAKRAAVDGGEDDPGEDVAGADLRPARRRTTAEGTGTVAERGHAAGRRGRRRAGAGRAEAENEDASSGEQSHGPEV